ncbi:MAG: endonuclease/exonuclease/phosphatase family protein [Phyllobacteriaceae bacterium]|nr:endonuclease/exonuclease/phosphatase family protein [Phyllobacteriaceae bacterium]
MSVRIATFNVENLLRRFSAERDRRTGAWIPDPAVGLFEHESEAEGRLIERALQVAISDDQRQMTAQAIRDCDADVLCLQEVDGLETLRWFHDRYLARALDEPYEHFALLEGNDRRGIDVAVASRRGLPIRVMSNATLTYRDLDLFDDELRRWGAAPDDRIVKRDALEVEGETAGGVLTLWICHFKSMTEGRERTMAVRRAEARAVRRLVEAKFGARTATADWAILGDLNDFRDRIRLVRGEAGTLEAICERVDATGCDPFHADRFAVDLVERLPPIERWTHHWAEGRELAALDHLFVSPALARANPDVRPRVIRAGLPYRVPVERMRPAPAAFARYPRVGFDRPKASDHCPVVVDLTLGGATR